MSWWSSFLDPFGISDSSGDFFTNFFDPLHIISPSGAARRSEERSERALNHQIEFDKWSQDFQERVFQSQNELARSPVSLLVKDAAKSGVNPMAAMGQSVGSVSASAPNSSVSSPSPVMPSNGMSSLLSLAASVFGSTTQAKSAERIAAMEDKTKNRALDIEENSVNNQKEYWDSLIKQNEKRIVIEQGHLENEQNKRLDAMLNSAREYYRQRIKDKNDLDVALKKLDATEEQIRVAASNGNKRLVASLIGTAGFLVASAVGQPYLGAAVAAFITGAAEKNPIGFQSK